MARFRRTETREEVAVARQPDPNDNPDDNSEAPSAPENDKDDAVSNPPNQQTALTTLTQSSAGT